MIRVLTLCRALLAGGLGIDARGAAAAASVVDVPSRAGVTQRFIYIAPEAPLAAVILFAGGNGGLQVAADGAIKALEGNFLVRSRDLFVQNGLAVAIVDAPSDRQRPPFLDGFRQRPEHVADIKAVIGWLRDQAKIPVWLIGNSRGTQSAAFVATQAPPANGGPDGLVLTSTIVVDPGGRPVPAMPLAGIAVPVLVVHHEQDGCRFCPFGEVPRMMARFTAAKKKELISFRGGENQGDPCEAFAYHGYNGLEKDVVTRIARWVRTH